MKTGPSTLGVQRSLGFGDRFGFASRAHLAVSREAKFAPVFAQQSSAELTQSGRSPAEVLVAVEPGSLEVWGADADQVSTPEEIERFVAAGFTRFTLDPSAYFVERAAEFSITELDAAAAALEEDGVFLGDWTEHYDSREFPIGDVGGLRFEREGLRRIAVKFGWALAFAEELTAHLCRLCASRPFEVEISLLRSARHTTPLEHLFVALEARRRGLPLVAIAPRLPGSWEAVAGYADEIGELESALRTHAAIAEAFGPHQVSVPEIEGKSEVLPLLGRACGARLSVKTSAASALEMMRVVARVAPATFREILVLAQERFAFERSLKPVSLSEDEVRFLPDVPDAQLESIFLGDARGRQLLDLTIGSIWHSGLNAQGRPMREVLSELLGSHKALYDDLLEDCLRSLITVIDAG